MSRSPRLVVLGLDSVPPQFLFDRFLPKMPHFKSLMARGRYGTLRSVDPPITVPAWAVMFTGVDPGTLGLYGFRHRKPGTYFDTYTPTPQMISRPPIWELLSRAGRRVAVIGMPPGYPPPTVNGVYVSDFLTPDKATDFVNPPGLGPEIQRVSDGYVFDLTFRAEDRARIAQELFAMTRKHFAVARYLWKKEPWDFFAFHEIGPDRLHHAFWKYFDPTHPRHVEDPHFTPLAEEYYALLDQEVGALLEAVGPDIPVWLASDHGSQPMAGCFCINEWLIEKGYLKLRSPPARNTPIEKADVDWNRTRVWGQGGYYGRIFFNIKGREPHGIVHPRDVGALREELVAQLRSVPRPSGLPLPVELRAPGELYRETRGDAPDLIAYFDELRWRSAGTVGHGTLFLTENDTGPDDAVHSFEGFYLLADGNLHNGSSGPAVDMIDVAPTLLTRLGLPLPPYLQGKPVHHLLES